MAVGTTAAILGGAVIGAGATAVAANQQRKGAEAAAEAQAESNREAQEYAEKRYEENKDIFNPFIVSGYNATGQLAKIAGKTPGAGQTFGYNQFVADPSYQFLQDEAAKAIERYTSGRGGRLSGGTLKALQARATGLASTEYGNAYNRWSNDQARDIARQGQDFGQLFNLAQIGLNAAGNRANLATNNASQVGGYITGAGTAEAMGHAGVAAANADAINQLGRISGSTLNKLNT